MVFSSRHEGWQGIPHGGLAMMALLDLADHCRILKQGENLTYPLITEWRFADSVQIGDEMQLRARMERDGRIALSMFHPGRDKIYLSAELRPLEEPGLVDFALLSPARMMSPGLQKQALGIYDNCFVCGHKRRSPGLERRFFRVEDDAGEAVIVRFGGARDLSLASFFQQYPGVLHPGVLAALLDEVCGWSGVLAGDLYGYTVRFQLILNRLPQLDEEFFGMTSLPAVKGSGARKFYFPQGALYLGGAGGELEIIAVAQGQWLAREELRRQFEASHFKEDLRAVFF